MSTGFELLGFGALAAVIAAIVLWVVVMPGRTKRPPGRGESRTRAAERSAWDPDIDAGRRHR
jgi:hypothetical protein